VGEFEAGLQTSKFDLTMIVDESDQGKIALNYCTDLFETGDRGSDASSLRAAA